MAATFSVTTFPIRVEIGTDFLKKEKNESRVHNVLHPLVTIRPAFSSNLFIQIDGGRLRLPNI